MTALFEMRIRLGVIRVASVSSRHYVKSWPS